MRRPDWGDVWLGGLVAALLTVAWFAATVETQERESSPEQIRMRLQQQARQAVAEAQENRLQIYLQQSATFIGGTTTVYVYKFQVGSQMICRAVVVVGSNPAPLGDVPCGQ